MKTTYTAKNYEIGDRFRAALDEKLAKIGRLAGSNATCTVTCTKVGDTKTLEIAVNTRGKFYRAAESGEKMYQNIDPTVSRVLNQLVKDKDKSITRRTGRTNPQLDNPEDVL